MSLNFQNANDLFDDWRVDVLSGKPPKLYPIGQDELSRIEIGPGKVTLLGGAPGAGKTAFAMQGIIDGLRLTDDLRVVVCNVEMSPMALLERQLARLSGVNLSIIRARKLTEAHNERIETGLATLKELADRLAFVRAPFDLQNVAATAKAFKAGLIVLDYIQRIKPPGDFGDKRASVDATMSHLRTFADAGNAVIVLSAVARTKDAKGRSSYDGDGLSLASFRESSELEFGADDAFILTPDGNNRVTLRHFKSRNGECRDLLLDFNRSLQHFKSPSLDELQTDAAKPSRRVPVGPDDDWEAK